MSEMLKPCPFCKGEFAFDFEEKNFRCGTCGATVPPDPYARTVNTRPIEDELTARIAELEYQLEDWTNNGWAEDYKARIAELETDNAEFRQLIRDWSIVLEQNNGFWLWQVESVRQAMLEINKEREG